MGLTHSRVAQISGLSRATFSRIENRSVGNLSLTKIAHLLDVLGLTSMIRPGRVKRSERSPAKTPGLILAARTAIVSYRDMLPAEVLNDLARRQLVTLNPKLDRHDRRRPRACCPATPTSSR